MMRYCLGTCRKTGRKPAGWSHICNTRICVSWVRWKSEIQQRLVLSVHSRLCRGHRISVYVPPAPTPPTLQPSPPQLFVLVVMRRRALGSRMAYYIKQDLIFAIIIRICTQQTECFKIYFHIKNTLWSMSLFTWLQLYSWKLPYDITSLFQLSISSR